MKKKITAILLFLVMTGSASAILAGIANTKHNMAHWSPYDVKASDENQICKFCHTPHAATPATPLWGHEESTASTFKKYSSGTLVVSQGGVIGTSEYNLITGATKLCLGCHDGITSVGALVSGETILMEIDKLTPGQGGYGGGSQVDISHKHPVSFVYDENMRDTYINPQKSNTYGLPGTVENGTIDNDQVEKKWLKSENKRVECNICHDPHENRATDNRDLLPFWVSPAYLPYSSHDAVCVACHQDVFNIFTNF